MGDHRHHYELCSGNVFRTHVTHQRPAVNQLHAGEMGEKMALLHRLPFVFTAADFIVRGGG